MMHYPTEWSPEVELLRDVEYGNVAGRPLLMDIARPAMREPGEALPAFVYLHGGSWATGSKEDGLPAIGFYASHGYVAASVDYRLSGEARFPAAVEDCKCAVRFLRAHAAQYGIASGKIGVMGASSGGHLAALLALSQDHFLEKGGWQDFSSSVSAVCDLFGVSDFLQMPPKHIPEALSATARFLGGTIDEVRDRYIEAGPVNYIHADAPPFLLIHGDVDALVPLHQSELLYTALRNAGVAAELLVVKGAEHGSRNVITPEVRAAILAFFKKHLKGA